MLLFGEAIPEDTKPARNERFRKAQAAYLQGDYFEAERLLASNLAQERSDIESGLLLISVLRRSCRFDEAIEQINLLRKRDFSVRWESELTLEKEKCLKRKRQSHDAPPPKAT
jgi:thioredoxin-like negative regulator of GroEL